jgi:hypothetical protein
MQNSCRKSADYDLKEPAALDGPPFEGAHYNNVSCPGQPEIRDDNVGQRRQARGCSRIATMDSRESWFFQPIQVLKRATQAANRSGS